MKYPLSGAPDEYRVQASKNGLVIDIHPSLLPVHDREPTMQARFHIYSQL